MDMLVVQIYKVYVLNLNYCNKKNKKVKRIGIKKLKISLSNIIKISKKKCQEKAKK